MGSSRHCFRWGMDGQFIQSIELLWRQYPKRSQAQWLRLATIRDNLLFHLLTRMDSFTLTTSIYCADIQQNPGKFPFVEIEPDVDPGKIPHLNVSNIDCTYQS